MKKTGYGIVLLIAVVGWAALGQQTPSENAWNIELEGRKTWTVRYGLGDSLALAGAGIGPGQLTLDQTMAVDFTASALSIFRIEGHFDDQEASSLQALSLYMDTDEIHAVAGDFAAPSMPGFFAGSLTMKGARVDAVWGDGSIVGIASLLSGTRDSRSFVGQTAQAERLLATAGSDAGRTYSTSLEGLGYFSLTGLYVDDFTEVRLRLGSAAQLPAVLARYGVGELAGAIETHGDQELAGNKYVVVGDATQSFLLEVEPESAVRELLRAAIRDYNQAGPETALTYPFVEGSEAEARFLRELESLLVVQVGDEDHVLGELGWRRFYDIGRTKVVPESVVAVVRLDGRTYVQVGDPDLVGYSVTTYAEEGILEASFPASFFEKKDAELKVSFSYSVSGGTYMLGASIIPGSERVTMAGRALARDVDYAIDYELGLLSLLVEIGPADPLLIEFERYSSGTGGSGAYGRGFYGVTASAPLGEGLAVDLYALRGVDQPGSVEHPESVKTMPNAQTVVGVRGQIDLPDLNANFDLGYTNDVFPQDDNQRARVPNSVLAIGAASGYTFVGNEAGFAAYDGAGWRSFGTSDGLSGRVVRAIAGHEDAVFFGTNDGLTVVELTGVSPFDKVANWSRYGDTEGLLDVSVRALLVDGDDLWIGTDGRLFRVAVDEMDDPDAWKAYAAPLLTGVQALCLHKGDLYAGTASELLRVDRATGAATSVGDETSAVHDLASDGETLYVARDAGLESYAGGARTGWIASDEPVSAVEVDQGEVFYGTSDGLVRLSDGGVRLAGWAVTTLASGEDALWAGSAGTRGGELFVWSLGAGEVAYGTGTTKIDPWNPRVYADPTPGDHTTTGWTAQASFSHEADGFSLVGSVDRVLPGFRAIDGRGRSDAGGWSVASDISLGADATLSLDHNYQVSDPDSDDALATADGRLAFQGSFGPQVSFVVDYQAEDAGVRDRGVEREGLSYDFTVSHRLFDEALSVSLAWGEDFSWAEGKTSRRQTSLVSQATLDVTRDVRTSLAWRRPVRIAGGEAKGSESWAWDNRAAFDVVGFAITATYGLDGSRPLAGEVALAHEATATVAAPDFTLEGWQVTPRLDLKAGHANSATSGSGRLSLQLDRDDWSARAVGSIDVSGLGTRVERWSEKLTSTASFSGIDGLRPSLSYTLARNLTRVEGQGSRASVTHSANGRLSWSGRDGESDTLSIVGRLQDSGSFSVSIDNAYARDATSWLARWIPALRNVQEPGAPSVSLRANLAADWRRDEDGGDSLNWETGVTIDATLSSTWSLSTGLSYYGGVKPNIDVFHGIVGELTVAIDF